MKLARFLSAVLALVLICGSAHAGNVAKSYKGEVVGSGQKSSPLKVPRWYPKKVEAKGATTTTTEAPDLDLGPQLAPACWGDNCSEANRLQNGG